MSFQKSNKPTASSSPQFKIETCKIKICKGYPLFWVHTRVYHLDRAWTWAHQLLDASCHRNPLPIPSWKVLNKNLQGIPSQKKSHMGISLRVRASSQNINQTNHSSTIRYPAVKIPPIQSWKTQNENLQGIPHQTGSDTGISLEYRAQTWAWSWSPLLGFLLRTPIHFNKDLSVSCPSTSNTQETQVTIADYGRQ